MSRYLVETPRLALREFTFEDVSFIIKLVNTEGWLRYIGDRNVHTEEQAKRYLENGPLKSYRENGFGLSCVLLKSTGTAIGMCGLLKRDYLEHPDVGFAFLPEHQGKGYAGEIVEAILHFAKNQLHIDTVQAIVMEENTLSRKLLEKVGMQYLKKIQLLGENTSLLLYSN